MNHKVFVAGASGAIGQRLVPLLCSAGHKVVGTTRTEQGAETLRALGSEPVIVDVFDAEALSRAVLAVQPKIIIHQLTGLSAWKAGCIEEAITENARVRTEGTRNLVKAALAAATRRLIARSLWQRFQHRGAERVHRDGEGSWGARLARRLSLIALIRKLAR